MPACFRRIAALICVVSVLCIALGALRAPACAAESLVNCPPLFLGDYPDDEEADWALDVQGLTHDDTHWYLTNTHNILRVPVGRDFAQDHFGEPSVAHRHRTSYPELLGYNHFGDMSYFNYNGNGYVLLGVDQGQPEGALALLRADDTLDLVDVAPFSGQSSAGWVAVDPGGFVYSSESAPSEFRKYAVNWADLETNGLVLTFVEAIPITDEAAAPYQLFDMQGGVVTPDGKALIISNGYEDCDNPTYGLHAFNLQTGQRIIRSCESGCDWIFQWDACDVGFLDEEPEGLTIWDLDGGAAPGMSGQLHVLLLNNDIIHDNAWMKHYALDTTPPQITCPQSITVECAAHGGTPATDAAIAAFLGGANATDTCDDNVDVVHDGPTFFNLGTTTVTFTATDDVLANQSTCTADVTVVDTTAPVIDVTLNRDVLWPPNHKMADIEATVTVTDVCDENAGFLLASIVSDEPDDDIGDGRTTGDIAGAETGTADTAFQLRSERRGTGDGREYTVIYCASDMSGNESCDTVAVEVPHDQSGTALAADGFDSSGKRLVPGAPRIALVIPSVMGMRAYDEGTNASELNAADIDASRVYVGNTIGALRPDESRVADVNGDDLPDLVVYYPSGAVRALAEAGGENPTEGRAEVRRFESVGLHYTTPGGSDFLVADIFGLGAPAIVPDPGIPPVLDPPTMSAEPPRITSLLGVYPNPFNPRTSVHFALSTPERVRVRVYDVSGALVRTLVDETRAAGEHAAEWDGRDGRGRALASGIYFVRMIAGPHQTTRKVVLLK